METEDLFQDLLPDEPVCAGAKIGLHQDKDERDLQALIVSVSLGMITTFVWRSYTYRDDTKDCALPWRDAIKGCPASRAGKPAY